MIGPKVGARREAEVYAWGDDAVVKLCRPGYLGHRAESVALARLDGHRVAPRLIDIVHCDGRPGLVLERLGGSDMLALLPRQPWRVLSLARALAKAHLAVHSVQTPGDLPDLRQVLAARIENAALPPRLRAFALRLLGGLPAGDRLCHGDFHPGSVLVAADRVSVIDWAGAARGVPEAGHARTVLLLRWADPLPGTPLISRGLMAAGRSAFAHGYARRYSGGSQRPLQLVDSWLAVHAAARVPEGIEAGQPKLIGLLGRVRRQAPR